jgi:SsrA-binding protein
MNKKMVCQNKKARHDYHIDEIIEAGIVLLGSEVKSLREGRASLTDSYARVKQAEVFLHNLHITPYAFASHAANLDPTRKRKLLLKKKEIKRLIGKTQEKGYTLIPVQVYFSENGYVKVALALAKGKKQYDKRQAIKERDQKREMDQARKKGQY